MQNELKSKLYSHLNKKWKETCKVLLGGEVGELEDFSEWLSSFKRPSLERQVNGKTAVYGAIPYLGSKWIAFEDINFDARSPSISINKCKDLDSLIEAVKENIVYAGSIVLGNCNQVESSTYVVDSHFVYRSEQIFESKYVAYSTHCLYSECLFGCQCASSSFGIRSNNYLCQRTMEVHKVDYSSDIYFSHSLSGCRECIFCFGLKNKSYCIGNLQLTKDEYYKIKAKLLEEMRDWLSETKSLPSLFEIASLHEPNRDGLEKLMEKNQKLAPEAKDLSSVSSVFAEACKIVLGKPRSPMRQYESWLLEQGALFKEEKSCISGKRILVPDYALFFKFPNERLLLEHEAEIAAQLSISKEEVNRISLSNAASAISKIAFFCPIWTVGNNKNCIDCPTSIDSSNCFMNVINIKAKYCAYNFWPRNSEAIFGSYGCGLSSAFCIKCYFSKNLSRCFEVDSGRSCSDCYFCHNIENCHNCILCFNVKNLSYAVGNCPLPKDQYLKVKEMLLSDLNQQLDKTYKIKQHVYSLG
ncbi:MAG: hypothetical protein QXN37_01990 [Candidatus Anstonellaceae archaeon]